MASKIKQSARTGVRYIITAFLIVALGQLLTFFNIVGESFAEKVLITFISLVVASILLWIATANEKISKV